MPVNIIDTLKPKNGGSFPIVEAIDVYVEGYSSLADAVSHFATDAMISAIELVLSGKADANDIVSLQNQINQIVISASAEAVVAPEVADARVGDDGTSYGTLKERLDAEYDITAEEIADVVNAVYDITSENVNISGITIVSGSYVNADTGGTSSNESYSYNSSYIDVSGCKYVEYSRIQVVSGQTHAGIAFYDESYDYISGETRIEGAEVAYVTSKIAVPEGAKYLRLSMRNDLTGFSVKLYHAANRCDKNADDIDSLGDKVEALNDALFGIVSRDVDLTEYQIVSGKFIRYDDGSVTSNDLYSYDFGYIDVSGCMYIDYSRIQVVSGQTYAGIAFYDSSYNYVSGEQRLEGAELKYVSSRVNVPAGAKYVRISLRNDLTGAFVKLYVSENKCDKNAADIEAIDGQITEINSEISTINSELFEIITKTLAQTDCNVISGKFANYDSDAVSSNESYSYARFVDLRGFDTITYSRIQIVSGQTHAGIQFLNGSGDFVGGQQRLTGDDVRYVTTTIPIPEGATSANISIRNDLTGWSVTLTKTRSKTESLITLTIGSKKISNAALRAAKERTFADGTAPFAEWYLVEDVESKEFYKTRDFKSFKYLFTASIENTNLYKYGITQNDDIIAVFRTESLSDVTTHTDSVRRNPYVFLASEDYKTQHEVDFGNSKKPSGWLSSVGFRLLPSGTVIFDEYTRPSVATANVWRLTGDLTDPANWEIVKTFNLSGDTSEGFKHCHSVMHDHYTDIVYFTTGDDNDGAMVWYSTDDGLTWTQITIADPSYNEKYFRILNYTFLEDYVYWSSDTGKSEYHYIFKAPRTQDGVIDYANVVDLLHLTQPISNYATYGTAYIPELDLLVLLERCDSNTATTAPVRAYSIGDDELYTIGEIETPDGNGRYLGFRTEYTEYYPEDGRIKVGFGQSFNYGDYRNTMKGFGNQGKAESIEKNVNNLYLKPYKVGDSYKMRLGALI